MGKLNKTMLLANMVVISVIIGVSYYIFLPALNIKSSGMWGYLIVLMFVTALVIQVLKGSYVGVEDKISMVLSIVGLVLVGLMILIILQGSTIFRAKAYTEIIAPDIREGYIEDYQPTLETVPLLDKDSALNIANRTMGGLEDVISQFEVVDTEQITIKGKPYRVAPLRYAGFIKWFNNKAEGVPGYILIDMQTHKAELVRVDEGIKYSKSERFGRDIRRHLRKNYKGSIFGEVTFELDDEKNPYWVASIIEPTIGLFGGKDVKGLVVVNAVNGEIQEYNLDNIPSWIDNVYDSKEVLSQYDYYGKYQDGFINAIFGQKGVRKTTMGYNYIPIGDDNWIYTGVTSAAQDESNIGFLLINKRTRETIFYPVTGAEEYSAMSSSEGMVQHLGYKATFPLLLQIEGEPTYLVALKDAGGLVKMYGMVNVERYQLVTTGTSIRETRQNYRELLQEQGIEVPEAKEEMEVKQEIKELKKIKIAVESIKEVVINGTTHILVKPEEVEIYYGLDVTENPEILFVEIGETIEIEYNKTINNKEDKIIMGVLVEN